MIEPIDDGFVVAVMTAMAFVTRAWHVLALRADTRALHRLRRRCR